MNFIHLRTGLAACAITVCLSGCVVTASSPGPPPEPVASGTLSLLFTIQGDTLPSDCDYLDATEIELVVLEDSDTYTTVYADCDGFDLSTSLPDGTYDGEVTLLDADEQPVTTTLYLSTLRVVSGTDLQVAIDFPPSSFLP